MSGPAAIERVAARLGAADIQLGEEDLAFIASALPALDAACVTVRAGAEATRSTTASVWRPHDAWVSARRDP